MRPEPRQAPEKKINYPHVPRPGYRFNGPSVAPPQGVESTLRATCDSMWENIKQAAGYEEAAEAQLRDLPALPPVGEEAAKIHSYVERCLGGWLVQAKSEKDHWQGRLSEYREYLRLHPELENVAFGAFCARHGKGCRPWDYVRERQPGEDEE
jgi:hypothetical protein